MLHNKWLRKINTLIHADKKEPVTITAKVGTFKRKQQMRDFLDHLPKDNHDDVFTATPFQNRRVKVNLGERHKYWCFLVLFQGCAPSLLAPCQQQTLPCVFGRGGFSTGLLTGALCLLAVRMRGAGLAQLSGAAEGTSTAGLQHAWPCPLGAAERCRPSGGCSFNPYAVETGPSWSQMDTSQEVFAFPPLSTSQI